MEWQPQGAGGDGGCCGMGGIGRSPHLPLFNPSGSSLLCPSSVACLPLNHVRRAEGMGDGVSVLPPPSLWRDIGIVSVCKGELWEEPTTPLVTLRPRALVDLQG